MMSRALCCSSAQGQTYKGDRRLKPSLFNIVIVGSGQGSAISNVTLILTPGRHSLLNTSAPMSKASAPVK